MFQKKLFTSLDHLVAQRRLPVNHLAAPQLPFTVISTSHRFPGLVHFVTRRAYTSKQSSISSGQYKVQSGNPLEGRDPHKRNSIFATWDLRIEHYFHRFAFIQNYRLRRGDREMPTKIGNCPMQLVRFKTRLCVYSQKPQCFSPLQCLGNCIIPLFSCSYSMIQLITNGNSME